METMIASYIADHWGILASMILGAVLTKSYVDKAQAKTKAEIEAHTSPGAVRDTLERLDDVAFDTVRWAMQTLVDPLRAEGKWDATVAADVEKAAIAQFEKILGADGVEAAKAVLSLKGPEWTAKVQADILSALRQFKQDDAPHPNTVLAENVSSMANAYLNAVDKAKADAPAALVKVEPLTAPAPVKP